MNNNDINENTIIVKHIPSEFTLNDCEELFSIFKSKSVTYFNKRGSMHHTAFVTFACYNDAYAAIFGLHERKILNSRLCAQFVKAKTSFNVEHREENENLQTGDMKCHKCSVNPDWIMKLLSISSKWELNNPIQPKLKYSYPSPNNVILTNITRCLAANKNFYTQTLHLMNKFHFPAPFTSEISFPGNLTVVDDKYIANNKSLKRRRHKVIESAEMEISSGNESEISDDDNYSKDKKYKLSFPKIPKITPSSNYEFISKPNEPVQIEDVFEKKEVKSDSHIAFRPILLSEANEKLDTNLSHCIVEEGFGKMEEPLGRNNRVAENLVGSDQMTQEQGNVENILSNEMFKLRKGKYMKESAGPNTNEKQNSNYIEKPTQIMSLDEIKINILSQSEWESVNALKNYNRGTPSNQLYIKNISKRVSKHDIISLYAGFVDWSNESEVASFQVTHFTEGRMKGQAFVSFSSQLTAEQALESTNAFLLLDKPISVQFSKNAQSQS